MNLHDLTAPDGASQERKRIGRGHGSGNGKTAGKGHKGQKARAGRGIRPGFEGGQMPLARRIPKRGFVNIFATRYEVVNLSSLDVFDDGAAVDLEALKAKRLVHGNKDGVKILGDGKITKKLTFSANAFSKTAKAKIKSAGGKIEVIK